MPTTTSFLLPSTLVPLYLRHGSPSSPAVPHVSLPTYPHVLAAASAASQDALCASVELAFPPLCIVLGSPFSSDAKGSDAALRSASRGKTADDQGGHSCYPRPCGRCRRAACYRGEQDGPGVETRGPLHLSPSGTHCAHAALLVSRSATSFLLKPTQHISTVYACVMSEAREREKGEREKRG